MIFIAPLILLLILGVISGGVLQRRGRRLGYLVQVPHVIPLVISMIGFLLALIVPIFMQREITYVTALPLVVAASDLDTISAESEVLLTGTLNNNDVLLDEQFDIGNFDLVIYRLEQWEPGDDDDNGTWATVRQRSPALQVMMDDERAAVVQPDDERGVFFGGDYAVYELVNSHRVVGFHDGDTVTARGIVNENNQIIVSTLHLGTKEDVLRSMNESAWVVSILGMSFAAVGGFIYIVFLFVFE